MHNVSEMRNIGKRKSHTRVVYVRGYFTYQFSHSLMLSMHFAFTQYNKENQALIVLSCLKLMRCCYSNFTWFIPANFNFFNFTGLVSWELFNVRPTMTRPLSKLKQNLDIIRIAGQFLMTSPICLSEIKATGHIKLVLIIWLWDILVYFINVKQYHALSLEIIYHF